VTWLANRGLISGVVGSGINVVSMIGRATDDNITTVSTR
jgi:hypothetical protein